VICDLHPLLTRKYIKLQIIIFAQKDTPVRFLVPACLAFVQHFFSQSNSLLLGDIDMMILAFFIPVAIPSQLQIGR
jgi:hypothetical protein